MKMNAPQSLKFSKLKRRLSVPHWQAVGILESLWLFTQVNAPAGDIGKHSDEDIAAGIEWAGNAEVLILTLTECGWLDRSDEFRLTVHDWEDHVPRYLKGALAKNGVAFVPKQPANDTKQPAKPNKQPAPIKAKPSKAKPSKADSLSAAVAPVEKKERPRDELFDAVAEVTAIDPKTSGGLIGDVCKELRKGDPHYSPDEVREFAARYGEICPWGPKDGRMRPTPKEVQKYIGGVRAKPPPTSAAIVAARPAQKSFRQADRDDATAVFSYLHENAPDANQLQLTGSEE